MEGLSVWHVYFIRYGLLRHHLKEIFSDQLGNSRFCLVDKDNLEVLDTDQDFIDAFKTKHSIPIYIALLRKKQQKCRLKRKPDPSEWPDTVVGEILVRPTSQSPLVRSVSFRTKKDPLAYLWVGNRIHKNSRPQFLNYLKTRPPYHHLCFKHSCKKSHTTYPRLLLAIAATDSIAVSIINQKIAGLSPVYTADVDSCCLSQQGTHVPLSFNMGLYTIPTLRSTPR